MGTSVDFSGRHVFMAALKLRTWEDLHFLGNTNRAWRLISSGSERLGANSGLFSQGSSQFTSPWTRCVPVLHSRSLYQNFGNRNLKSHFFLHLKWGKLKRKRLSAQGLLEGAARRSKLHSSVTDARPPVKGLT